MLSLKSNLRAQAFIIEQHVNYPELTPYALAKFLNIPESAVRSAVKKYYAPITGFDVVATKGSKINSKWREKNHKAA